MSATFHIGLQGLHELNRLCGLENLLASVV